MEERSNWEHTFSPRSIPEGAAGVALLFSPTRTKFYFADASINVTGYSMVRAGKAKALTRSVLFTWPTGSFEQGIRVEIPFRGVRPYLLEKEVVWVVDEAEAAEGEPQTRSRSTRGKSVQVAQSKVEDEQSADDVLKERRLQIEKRKNTDPKAVTEGRRFFTDLDVVTSPSLLESRQRVAMGALARRDAVLGLERAFQERVLLLGARHKYGTGFGVKPWPDDLYRERDGISSVMYEVIGRHFGFGDDFKPERAAAVFELFALGKLQFDGWDPTVCSPNSAHIFFFACFAMMAIETGDAQTEFWKRLFPHWIQTAAIYVRVAKRPTSKFFSSWGVVDKRRVPAAEENLAEIKAEYSGATFSDCVQRFGNLCWDAFSTQIKRDYKP